MRWMLLAGLLFAAPAHAQTVPQEGMVAEPCTGLAVQVPPAVLGFIRSVQQLDPGATLPPPPPELAEYRAANAEARKRDWADLCRYRADNARLAAAPASGRRVVFIGDSITQGWETADPALFAGGVVNRGISGQTSPQMLLRFMSDVVALKPRVVHIMTGTNDLAGNTGPNSAEEYRGTIRAMATLAKAAGIKVILASIPPTSGFAWKPAVKPVMLGELNAWLKIYAREEGLGFIDYHAALAEPDGAMRRALTYDGVHPNAEGYAVMGRLARVAISGK